MTTSAVEAARVAAVGMILMVVVADVAVAMILKGVAAGVVVEMNLKSAAAASVVAVAVVATATMKMAVPVGVAKFCSFLLFYLLTSLPLLD